MIFFVKRHEKKIRREETARILSEQFAGDVKVHSRICANCDYVYSDYFNGLECPRCTSNSTMKVIELKESDSLLSTRKSSWPFNPESNLIVKKILSRELPKKYFQPLLLDISRKEVLVQ